jgi:hypothetical protein
MVTGILEGIGAAIGVAGLLAGFKGAVDGYLLIESIFDKDNGLIDLVLDYNIESERLTSWGDRFNVKAAREEDCLFHHERGPIKALMAEIFGRIEYFHEQSRKFLELHEVSDHRVDHEKITAPGTGLHRFMQLGNKAVQAVSKEQKAKKQKKRAMLAIKNRAKFEEVVRRLRKANDDLLGLLSEPSLDAFMRALPAYVLAHANNNAQLQQARSITGMQNDLIRQSARLKLLQSPSANSYRATMIDSLTVQPATTNAQGGSRKISIYDKVVRVWIEWLEIEQTLSTVEVTNIQGRIKTLSHMLETSPESFNIARCMGYINDQDNPRRTGLVFRIPQEIGTITPISLLDIIRKHKEIKQPALGDKFVLAQMLATTLMQLHASNWLHKAFRGDNILFLPKSPGDISSPLLAGFEYARDTTMQSIGQRPTGQNELDYYYHPDVGDGFSKTLDLYSLGVVLLEIAYWRPLATKIPPRDAKSLKSIQQLFIKSADALDPVVGAIYSSVVRLCLNCQLPDPSLEAEFACAMNTEIVLRLERCVA